VIRSSLLTRFSSFALALVLTSVATGCNVGPKYARPNYTAPSAYRGADEAAVSSDPKQTLGDEKWSAVYQEPELQDLIRKALANNYDVRIAAQHILEQQAQVKITRSPPRCHRRWAHRSEARLSTDLSISLPLGHLISGDTTASRQRRRARSCWRRHGLSGPFN